jgi:acyl-CoA thioester hydrolase
MEKFNVKTEIHVRFSDTDAMGHVNNAKFFSYMEQGRVAYVQRIVPDLDMENGLKDFPFILADVQCSFKEPLFCDETVVVSLRVSKMGNKSFVLDYLIEEKATGRLVATGSSVQVMYDYKKGRSYPIPAELRRRIEEIEGCTISNQ